MECFGWEYRKGQAPSKFGYFSLFIHLSIELIVIKICWLSLAELHVVGPNRMEINFASIALTDELRQLNGRIIGCTYVDNQWVFARGRHDREHPNGRIAIESISAYYAVIDVLLLILK